MILSEACDALQGLFRVGDDNQRVLNLSRSAVQRKMARVQVAFDKFRARHDAYMGRRCRQKSRFS